MPGKPSPTATDWRAPRRAVEPVDARMVAVADRLLADFAQLPVGAVLRAIAGAHTTMRERGRSSEPHEIEALVRGVLRTA